MLWFMPLLFFQVHTTNFTFYYTKWKSRVIRVSIQTILRWLEVRKCCAFVSCNHNLLFKLLPLLRKFRVILLIKAYVCRCLFLTYIWMLKITVTSVCQGENLFPSSFHISILAAGTKFNCNFLEYLFCTCLKNQVKESGPDQTVFSKL